MDTRTSKAVVCRVATVVATMEVMGAAAGREVQVMAAVTGVMWVVALLVVRTAEVETVGV